MQTETMTRDEFLIKIATQQGYKWYQCKFGSPSRGARLMDDTTAERLKHVYIPWPDYERATGEIIEDVPRYLDSISDAWPLLEALAGDGWQFDVGRNGNKHAPAYYVRMNKGEDRDERWIMAYGRTAPEAICLAVYEALTGVRVELVEGEENAAVKS